VGRGGKPRVAPWPRGAPSCSRGSRAHRRRRRRRDRDGARDCPRLRPSPPRVAVGLLSGGRGSYTCRRHWRRRGRGWDAGPPSLAPVVATVGGRWPALRRPWIPRPVTTATGGEAGMGAGPPLLAPVATGGRWPAPPEDRWPRASSEKTILKRPWWRRRPHGVRKRPGRAPAAEACAE
jgi:hypothetical protein